jgi:hypothetical protein
MPTPFDGTAGELHAGFHVDIQATPDFGRAMGARFIDGMATAGNTLVVLLAIPRVLGGEDLAGLSSEI